MTNKWPTIDGYEILGVLGRGESGVVYQARRPNGTPRVVALKLLRPCGAKQTQRFQREIEVQRALDCPGIVKCIDSGSTQGTLYYCMEWIEGVSLDRYLVQSRLTLADKLAVFERLCHAIAHAHARGVAHRDLKPGNVLVDAEGNPHVLDFGICRVEPDLQGAQPRSSLTRTGDILGTIKYMSPEQAWGGLLGRIDARSDIWALGVMLYEIASGGDYPYDLGPAPGRPEAEALLDRIRQERPRAPRIADAARAADLKRLIERCLVHEPHERLQSASELARDIGRVRARRRAGIRPLSLRYRCKRIAIGWALHWRGALWSASIAGAVALLAALAFKLPVRWRVSGADGWQTPAAGALAALRSDADPVVIVGVGDQTADAVVEFARQRGMPNVTRDIRTWRGLHGLIMRRLAAARPRAVAWDYYFQSRQSADAELVGGVRALESVGTPVILAVHRSRDDGAADLSDDIRTPLAELARCGRILASDPVAQPGEFVIALRHGRQIEPGLALATVAAAFHPECRVVLDWSESNAELALKYEQLGRPGAYLGTWDRVGLSKVFPSPRDQNGARAGDLLACKVFELKRPEHWARRTVPYERILEYTDSELATAAAGKIVIVGDVRSPEGDQPRDLHAVRYGLEVVQNLPGCYLHADAVCGLLANRSLMPAFRPSLAPIVTMCLVALAASALLAPRAARRLLERPQLRRWTTVAALAGIATCALGLAVTLSWWRVHLLMAAIAALVGSAGALLIESARTRYLVPRMTVGEHGPAPLSGRLGGRERQRAEQDEQRG